MINCHNLAGSMSSWMHAGKLLEVIVLAVPSFVVFLSKSLFQVRALGKQRQYLS